MAAHLMEVETGSARADPPARAGHRVRTFKRSTDPHFAAKLDDVVGLYMAPPRHTIVLSVDEKSQIQALDRTQPGLPLKPGKCATFSHRDMAAAALARRADAIRSFFVEVVCAGARGPACRSSAASESRPNSA